jgi:hypothetical protein
VYLRVFIDHAAAVVKFATFAGHRPELSGLLIPYAIAYRQTFPHPSQSLLGMHEAGDAPYDTPSLRTDKHVMTGYTLNTYSLSIIVGGAVTFYWI